MSGWPAPDQTAHRTWCRRDPADGRTAAGAGRPLRRAHRLRSACSGRSVPLVPDHTAPHPGVARGERTGRPHADAGRPLAGVTGVEKFGFSGARQAVAELKASGHAIRHTSDTRLLRPAVATNNAEDPDYVVIYPTFS